MTVKQIRGRVVLFVNRHFFGLLFVAILAASISVFRQLSVLTSDGLIVVQPHPSSVRKTSDYLPANEKGKDSTIGLMTSDEIAQQPENQTTPSHDSAILQLTDIKEQLSRYALRFLGEKDIEAIAAYQELNPTQKHEQLREFYTNISHSEDGNLWDDPNNRLPEWMKLYFTWHQHVRKSINTNIQGHRYLVMMCTINDKSCGGLSDRLKPLPLMIRAAYYSKRILLIHWDTPRPLTDFLVPPRGGLDWRTPSWLLRQIHNLFGLYRDLDVSAVAVSSRDIARAKYQDYHGGSYVYDNDLVEDEKHFRDVFHDVWRIAFTPTAPVRELIESEMNRLGLVPGQYTGAHLRALYKYPNRPERIQRNWAQNALNCASELRPGKKKIFFASDSALAANIASAYGDTRNVTVVTRNVTENPIHMDKRIDPANPPNASDYFEVFVDLYILAQADCVTFSKGGYGILGLFMNRNVTCRVRQDALGKTLVKKPCRWVDDPMKGTTLTHLHWAGSFVASNETVYIPETAQ